MPKATRSNLARQGRPQSGFSRRLRLARRASKNVTSSAEPAPSKELTIAAEVSVCSDQ